MLQTWLVQTRHLDRDEDGQALLMIALLSSVFFVLGLFAASVGVMITGQVSAQRAADAAALAGCMDLPDTAAATTSATSYGASSGGRNASTTSNLESGNGGQTVAVAFSDYRNPASGHLLTNGKISVDVTRTQPLLGVPAWGFTDQTIKAHAACKRHEGGVPVLLALDPSASSSLKMESSFNANLGTTGGIVADSTNSTGLRMLGSSTVKAQYLHVGNTDAAFAASNGTVCTPSVQTNCYSPPPTTGTYPDPFCVPSPPPNGFTAGCKLEPGASGAPSIPSAPSPFPPTGCTQANGSNKPVVCVSGTVPPGSYSGGLQLGDCGAKTAQTLTLSSGIYYMNTGGLQVCGNATLRCANYAVGSCDVMFFNGGSSCGSSDIGAAAKVLLSPPQTPPTSSSDTSINYYYQILFFQSRSCSQNLTIEAGVTLGLNPNGSTPCVGTTGQATLSCGAIYVPGCASGAVNYEQASGCTPQVQPTINISPNGLGQISPCSTINGTSYSDCINTAIIGDELDIGGPELLNNPQLYSGSVLNGDVALSE